MDDTYTLLGKLVEAVMVKSATHRTLFMANLAYREAAENDPGPSVTGVDVSPESNNAFDARWDAYLADYLATKVQDAAYDAAVAHIRATDAACSGVTEAVRVANAAWDAARQGLQVAIVSNRTEYDIAAHLGSPYPDAIYDAMDDMTDASENVLRATFDHVHALSAATSHVNAGVVQ